MTDWWRAVEQELARDEHERSELPDPWGQLFPADAGAGPSLTAAQEAFLAGLGDQPAVPRLGGLSGGPDHDGQAEPAADAGPGHAGTTDRVESGGHSSTREDPRG